MTDEDGDTEDAGTRQTEVSGTTTVTTTATTASVWAVPTLEHDFQERCEEIQEAIRNSESYQDFLDEHQDTVVILFAIANELLNEQVEQLLIQELLSERIKNDEGVKERVIMDKLSGKDKGELLRHYNLVDEEDNVADTIKETIRYRNRIIHEPQKRYRIQDLDTLSERIETAKKAIEGIAEYIDDNGD